MECLFCSIAAGEQRVFLVHHDNAVVAFLDTRPVFKGHLLVIPRDHFETLTDLPDVTPFFRGVQAGSRAVETGLHTDGYFVAMNNRISQSVPHLHAHIVPRHKKDGLKGFFWPRTRYADDAEAQSYADAIRGAWT